MKNNFITNTKDFSQYDKTFKLNIDNHEEECMILKPEELSNKEEHTEYVVKDCLSSNIKFKIN